MPTQRQHSESMPYSNILALERRVERMRLILERARKECLPPADERYGQYSVLDASLGREWLDRNRTGIAGVGFAQEPEKLPRLADRKRPRIDGLRRRIP